MARYRWVWAATLLAGVWAAPLAAQTYDWQYQWYWGAKGGALAYQLPTSGRTFAAQFGGEWLITARRTALYVGYSQSPTAQQDTFRLNGVTQPVRIGFNGMGRLQIAVVVLLANGALQPYLGGGFVIETLSDAAIVPNQGLSTAALQTADRELEQERSGGFGLLTAGLQLRMGRRLALYGHYQGSAQGRDFLLSGSSNSFEAGLRYALVGAREDDITTRR